MADRANFIQAQAAHKRQEASKGSRNQSSTYGENHLSPTEYLMAKNVESAKSLITFNGALGDYTISTHIAVLAGCVMLILLGMISIARLRGVSDDIAAGLVKDLLFGVLWGFTFIGFPYFIYQLGRTYFIAATTSVGKTQS